MDVESFISLLGVENKRDGADYLIVCPFHNDHKPSLRVYGGKGHEGYHCYSCGSNGTWAHLYKEIKGCEWKEAYDVLGIDGDYKTESRPSPIRFDFVDPENPAFVKAINELRDDFALSQFGKKYSQLDEDKQKIAREAVPQNISEAEPKDTKK